MSAPDNQIVAQTPDPDTVTGGTPARWAGDHDPLVDLHHLVHRLVEVVGRAEHRGQLSAVESSGSPVPGDVLGDPRRWWAEAWVAACVTAEAPAPPASDWASIIDVYPLPAVERDPEHAYGVWRTLAWIVGVRRDVPVELPERDAAGHGCVDGPRYATQPNPDSAVCHAAEARRRNPRPERRRGRTGRACLRTGTSSRGRMVAGGPRRPRAEISRLDRTADVASTVGRRRSHDACLRRCLRGSGLGVGRVVRLRATGEREVERDGCSGAIAVCGDDVGKLTGEP
jgi:hypothetical protein